MRRAAYELSLSSRVHPDRLADSTGGREIRAALFRESTVGPLRDVLEEVRGSYVIRYTPTGVPATGWHPIKVQVTKTGTYDIRARPGFER